MHKKEALEKLGRDFAGDVQKLFADSLISVIMYGSAVRQDFNPKKSDINFLIVAREDAMQRLDELFPVLKKWSSRGVATPLVLTQEYIHSSLDSFPIEFLNLKKNHRLIVGDDVLSSLDIPLQNLRLQCEEQLKGKLLHLRSGFLSTFGRTPLMKRLLRSTIPAMASIFTSLLALKGIDAPPTVEQVFIRTAQAFEVNADVLKKVLRVGNKDGLSNTELLHVTKAYIAEIEKLSVKIDKWQN